MQSGPYFCPILTKFVIFRQIFTDVPNIKFHANLPSESRADIYGHTDGQTDTISVEEFKSLATMERT
jgi:hypothetical protein